MCTLSHCLRAVLTETPTTHYLRAQEQQVVEFLLNTPELCPSGQEMTAYIAAPQSTSDHIEALRGTPPPCRSPPLVVPRGGGGLGDRHFVNPKFFVAPHCVVVWVTVLWGTATCIPCTHGRTFCSLSLKWNLTTQPCSPPGQM